MIKLLFVIGSPRKTGIGYQFAKQLKQHIYQQADDSQSIIIDEAHLSDMNYKDCVGCTQCFISGECKLSKVDNYDFDKRLENYHGIVIFIPTYIHQMPGKLKNCFDRMAYRFHEFPLLGKKAVIITYTASNGAEELAHYAKGMFTILGAEVVDSHIVYELNESFETAAEKIYCSVLDMINRINNNNYQITELQEKEFACLKDIIHTELEQKLNTYKQKRWSELMKYNSLKEYISSKYILNF